VAYNPAIVEKGQQKLAECVVVPAGALRGKRWDPAYWISPPAEPSELSAVPWAPLGDFVEHITYGPIVTGRRPEPVPRGVAIIDQKVLRPTGVLLDQAVRVAEGCEYDLPRCRLQPGDVLFARSGAGTLRKKRFTVYREAAKATVSCFVDLVRLRGINPYYVATVLRSRLGWPQIERLANGVGTPNLSFGEIRSLRIPVASDEEQRDTERAWDPVCEAHAAGRLEAAEALLDAVVARLENRLIGKTEYRISNAEH